MTNQTDEVTSHLFRAPQKRSTGSGALRGGSAEAYLDLQLYHFILPPGVGLKSYFFPLAKR